MIEFVDEAVELEVVEVVKFVVEKVKDVKLEVVLLLNVVADELTEVEFIDDEVEEAAIDMPLEVDNDELGELDELAIDVEFRRVV